MQQIINLLFIIGFIFLSFAVGGWYIDHQEKQEQEQKEWQKDRYFKRLFKSADWEEVVEIAERK